MNDEFTEESALETIAAELDGLPKVVNLGFSSRFLATLHDDEASFYMLGSMGMASSIGLGLSLATNKTVYAIEGDGSLLMNLGALSTVGRYPSMLIILLLDNGVHNSTGGQRTAALNTDFCEIAKACSIPQIFEIRTSEDFRKFLRKTRLYNVNGPIVVRLKVTPMKESPGRVKLSPTDIRDRFVQKISPSS